MCTYSCSLDCERGSSANRCGAVRRRDPKLKAMRWNLQHPTNGRMYLDERQIKLWYAVPRANNPSDLPCPPVASAHPAMLYEPLEWPSR